MLLEWSQLSVAVQLVGGEVIGVEPVRLVDWSSRLSRVLHWNLCIIVC